MRERVERGFAAWGHLAYRHAWLVIAVMLAVVVLLGSQLPKIGFDTSTEGFFREDDPVRVAYDDFRRGFGQDTMILVAVRPEGDVFDLENLERLRALHRDIEDEVPLLVEVTSLWNARETRGVGDELVVGDFLEDWPESPEEARAARERALANPLYRNQLVSPDGRLTTIVIEIEAYSRLGESEDELAGFDDVEPAAPGEDTPFLTGEENTRIIEALFAVVQRHRGSDFELHLSGSPVFLVEFQKAMQRDMARFASLAVLMIAVCLGALFRRTAAVILPLVTVLLSLASTLGIMAWSGTPLTLPTQILPSFLLAVGIGGSVHILAIFYQARRRGDSREDAIAFALGHSGLAVVMTSITTAGGLLSFAAAELRPIGHFGIFAPVGVMMALLFTVVLLPALIAVFPTRQERPGVGVGGPALSQRLLLRAGDFATRRAGLVAGSWVLLLVAAAVGTTRVHLSHDPVSWWPPGHPIRMAQELVNDEFAGSLFIELLVETGAENGLHEPEFLRAVEDLQTDAEALRDGDLYVGKSMSLADVVKEIHQALNENRPEARVLPDDRRLVAQELLLFENSGSDDLEDFVDPLFQTGRVTFKLPFLDATRYPAFLRRVEERAAALLGGADFQLTGMGTLITHTIYAVMHTMVRSYLLALMLVMPLLVLLIGNLRLGLTAIIPNLAPIVMALGLMGWAGIGLDTFTLLIGCIAIGLAVDDTIHFMHNFRRYYAASGDVHRAVRQTLETTGQALLFTSLVLSLGFLLYTLAEMQVLLHFGFLTAFTIIMAFLADVLLAPALMVLVTGARAAESARSMELEATQ
ncbi:MAG: efflux RND transporter permease subunit [Myxococcota bacterium]|nr:efflux RND transporter permease subunit [Myxococcota bacterium]